jgi:hypothetical protein
MRAAIVAITLGAAHAAAAAPQLVCTTEGRALRANDRAPLDHPVACVIDAGGLHADGARVAIVIERPFAIDPEIDPHPASRDGARWIAAPFTPARCALTTFRGELRDGDHAVWAGELTVRPECKAPSFAHAPALACTKHVIIDPEWARSPRGFHEEIDCELVVTDPPSGPALIAWFRRTPPGDATTTDTDTMHSEGDDTEHVRATLVEPTEEVPCAPVRVDAAITREGGIVWVGHTTYTPACPKARR